VTAPSRPPTRLEAGARLIVAEGRWQIERAGSALAAETEPDSAHAIEPPAPAVSNDEEKSRALPRARESSTGWRRLYLAGDYAGALRVARDRGLDRLALQLDAAALADLADSARLGGDPSAALQLLAALERRFPASEWASRASFLSGRLLERQKRHADAILAFERHLERDPEGN
jgi:TolA-binding protein